MVLLRYEPRSVKGINGEAGRDTQSGAGGLHAGQGTALLGEEDEISDIFKEEAMAVDGGSDDDNTDEE